LQAGIIGGITGAAFGWAGGAAGTPTSAARYLAHAAIGCGSSLANGGGLADCARGAASAVVGKYVTNTTNSWGVGVAQFTAATVAGGVTSVILGGTFQNGAATAAYGYLFNSLLHPTNTIEAAFRQAIARGDVIELQTLIEASGMSLEAGELAVARNALTAMTTGFVA
jgi:hypothetical protein